MRTYENIPPAANVGAMWHRHWGLPTIAGTVVITIVSSILLFRLTAFLYINVAYGRTAWESGLRVVGNKGHLSNGGELSRTGHLIVYEGSGLLEVPFLVGSAIGLPYLRMRLRGERLAEQYDRWKDENERGRF